MTLALISGTRTIGNEKSKERTSKYWLKSFFHYYILPLLGIGKEVIPKAGRSTNRNGYDCTNELTGFQKSFEPFIFRCKFEFFKFHNDVFTDANI